MYPNFQILIEIVLMAYYFIQDNLYENSISKNLLTNDTTRRNYG